MIHFRVQNGRLFAIIVVCLTLYSALPMKASLAQTTPSFCQIMHNTSFSTQGLTVIGGQPIRPGETLMIEFTANSATQVTVLGSYFPTYTQTLPFSVNYASIPSGETFAVGAIGSMFALFRYKFVCTVATATPPPEIACPIFFDGRLNDCDAGQTAAVYCENDGSVTVLAIFESKGYSALVASPAEIALVPSNPAKNTLIKSGNGAHLYRLMSGELQVSRAEDGTGKLYRFVFSDCPTP